MKVFIFFKIPILIISLIGLTVFCIAQTPQTYPDWGDWSKWGDQHNGNFRNPVLPGDFSDIDCIRVGKDYYAVTSTFQFSPGFMI